MALAYWPALRAGFVFDDHILVEGNRFLRGPLWKAWFTTGPTDFWPLTWTAFWLEWRLWGEQAWGYHAVNLAVHATAAILLWRVLRRLRVPGAGVAGLLFAVHPVAVESAAWISEQKNTLSAVLLECAVLAWIAFVDDRRKGKYALALSLFGLALLAKASVVMAPFLLLGIVLARRRRLEWRDAGLAAPFFALSLVVGLANVWFQSRNAMAGGWAPHRGFGERLGGAAWALLSYLEKAFLPVRLALVYPDWPVRPDSWLFYVPLAGLLTAAGLAVWAAPRWKWVRSCLWGLGYHFVQVLPVLGLVDMAFLAIAPVSNHLQYLALMGPVALAGAGIAALAARFGRAAWAGAGLLVLGLGAATFHRAQAFEDDRSLWTAAVRDAPTSSYAHWQLSAELLEMGDAGRAVAELDRAAELARDPADRHRLRALALLYAGRRGDAASEARASIREGGNPDCRRDAAVVLLQAGETEEALPVLRELAKAAPGASDYTYWLAAALSRSGRVGEAVDLLEAWCRERPGHPRMEQTLAVLLVRLGRVAEARGHAAVTLGVEPQDPRAAILLEQWVRSGRLQ